MATFLIRPESRGLDQTNTGDFAGVQYGLQTRVRAKHLLTDISSDTTLAAYDQVLHLAPPTRGAVTGLREWTKLTQPITDPSQDYLKSKEVLGDRKWSDAYEDVEHSDLASLNRRADSWLANKLPMTRFRLLFLVSFIMFFVIETTFVEWNSRTYASVAERLDLLRRRETSFVHLARFKSREIRQHDRRPRHRRSEYLRHYGIAL
jgi:hypothetical protein